MYMHRPNLDLESMMDKASTPNRLRAPTPIRKVPVRMAPLPNKENLINPNNQWMPQPNNRNYDDLPSNKPTMLSDNIGKKPLISPVRNPFKTQIQNMYGDQKRSQRTNGRQTPHLQHQQPQTNFNEFPVCHNHPNKPAEFNIDIQDQCMAYCGRCAAQLASQGFQVSKIQQMTVKKNQPSRNFNNHQENQNQQARQLPRYPEYEGNPMYQLILQFLTQLSQVQNEHLQNMTRLTMIDNHYTEQIDHTKDFYTQLLTFVQQMRDDHLNDLYEQSRKHSQIADIEHDYLRENVDQMNNIRNDIEENLQTIVEKLEEEDLKNNLNYYKQKIQVYKHKVQQQSQFFDKLINFSHEEYQSKLARVQDFLMDVWNTDSQSVKPLPPQPQKFAQKFMPTQNNGRTANMQFKQQDFPMKPQNQMPMQQMLPMQPTKNVSYNNNNTKKPAPIQTTPEEGQPAFRRLFEQEQQVMVETSPQFKKI